MKTTPKSSPAWTALPWMEVVSPAISGSAEVPGNSGNILDRFQYGYNAASLRLWRGNALAGNATRATQTVSASSSPPTSGNLDESYAYDGFDQITQLALGQLNATRTGIGASLLQQENWSYDPVGNWDNYQRQTQNTPILNQSRTHNAANEITTLNGSPAAISYDAVGQMTIVPSDATGTNVPFVVIWDAWQRPVYVRGGPETIDIHYEYDGLHRRTRQIVTAGNAPSLDFYYNDDWKIIEERHSDTGYLRAQYVHGLRGHNDLILRDISSADIPHLPPPPPPTSSSSSSSSSPISIIPWVNSSELPPLPPQSYWVRHYSLSDAMQNTTAITDITGTVLQRYRYSAFGEVTHMTPDFLDTTTDLANWNVLFHGEYYDPLTNWADYGYRYYAPSLGRWLSFDPIGENGGTNLYAFAANDALNIADALGMSPLSPDAPSVETLINIRDEAKRRLDAYDHGYSQISGFYSLFVGLAKWSDSKRRKIKNQHDFYSALVRAHESIGPNGYGDWDVSRRIDHAFGEHKEMTDEFRQYFKPVEGFIATKETVETFEFVENYGKLYWEITSFFIAGKPAYSAIESSSKLTMASSKLRLSKEYLKYRRNPDLNRAQARYLMEPYKGMGHHFIPRRSPLPGWIVHNRLNVMGHGMTRGKAYQRHFLGDYFFPGARLPARLGGKHHYWTGELMRLKRPIKPFHLWYGAPNWLRITGGIGAAAGGGATIYYLSDED